MSNRKGCVASWKMRGTDAVGGCAHKLDASVFVLLSISQRQPKPTPEGLTCRRYLNHGVPINVARASVRKAPERSHIDSRFCRRRDLHGLEERPRGFRGVNSSLLGGGAHLRSVGPVPTPEQRLFACAHVSLDQKHLTAEVMRRIRAQRTYADSPLLLTTHNYDIV